MRTFLYQGRMMERKGVRLRSLSVVAVLTTAGCDGFLQVNGVVRDTGGRPIVGAHVLLVSAGEGKVEKKTDSKGCFWVDKGIAPGRYKYDLSVESIGYEPATAEVEITREENVSIVLARKGSSSASQVEKLLQDPCSAR